MFGKHIILFVVLAFQVVQLLENMDPLSYIASTISPGIFQSHNQKE